MRASNSVSPPQSIAGPAFPATRFVPTRKSRAVFIGIGIGIGFGIDGRIDPDSDTDTDPDGIALFPWLAVYLGI
jgi:hypothetical protein